MSDSARTTGPEDPGCRTFRESVAVLVQLLAGRSGDAGDRLAAGHPAPADFVRFIEHHRLAWYLDAHLDRVELERRFGASDLDRIRAATAGRRATQARLVDEMHRLLPEFRRRDIDVILLKGPYLAERFSGIRRRAFLDLDLLVRGPQLRDAERLLVELGHERLSTMLLSHSLCARFTHGFDFGNGDVRLDLHWSLGAHGSYRIDHDRIWRRRLSRRLQDGTVAAVLSDQDALFFLLLSMFEDLDRGAARLRLFVDLYAVLTDLDATLDWDAFWIERRADRTASVCRSALGLYFAVFETEHLFPCAASSVRTTIDEMRRRPCAETQSLVEGSQAVIWNKLWALSRYENPVWLNLGWWVVSLPFRLAVYHPRPPRKPRR